MSGARLLFAGMNLTGDIPVAGGYWFETLADGFSLGSPEGVRIVSESLMRDGSASRIDRYENRTVTFTVRVCGSDLQSLADAEAALSLAVTGSSRQQLAWTPPDGIGKTTVFEVMTASLDPVFDDLAEVRPVVKRRSYTLTLDCLPFGHAATAVTQTLTPAVVSPTVVDGCTSTANWSSSGSYPASLSTATYLGESVLSATFTSVGAGSKQTNIVYSGTKPTTDFVALDVNWDGNTSTGRTVSLQGVAPQSTETITLGTGTYTRYWFATPAPAATWTFLFEQTVTAGGVNVVPWRIANLVSSATVGASGVMSVATLGSVRATGSVTLSRASAMTYAIVYADPQLDQFSPAVQGTWKYGLAGTYLVLAASGTFATNDVATLTFTNTAGVSVSTPQTKLNAEIAGLPLQPLGMVDLGGFDTGLIGAQTVTATKNGASSTVPSLRLFRLAEDTTFTYGAGFSGTSLVMREPSVDYPAGAFYMNGTDVWGKMVSPVFPVIQVPRTALYVEANNSAAAPVTLTLEYLPNFHTYSAA